MDPWFQTNSGSRIGNMVCGNGRASEMALGNWVLGNWAYSRMIGCRRFHLVLVGLLVLASGWGRLPAAAAQELAEQVAYRGPLDVVVAEDESWAVTANELSHSLSLIDLARQQVVSESRCAAGPAALVRLPGAELLVSCREAGCVERWRVVADSAGHWELQRVASVTTGFEPLGLAAEATGQRAYVGLLASGEVAEIDLRHNRLTRRLPLGQWPRSLALSPDGRRLAVGLSGESLIAVVDTASGERLYEEPLSGGINFGHMRCSQDGLHVYIPWMIYRSNPITKDNIRRGWVLASRVARLRLDGPAYRQAIALDVPRRAVADPHGLALTPNEHRLAVSSAGTHELLVYRLGDLPFVGAGGPGDLIDERLLRDDDLFYRIELGGRPLGLQAGGDNRTVFVANHTLDALQIVDLEERRLSGTISLGIQPDDPQQQLVHRGRELFHDAGRSLDQWYSCHSCHLDGGSNAKAMDTWNDGTELTAKTVLPLNGVTQTGPWTWHGWQQDLDASIQNSLVSTMQGAAGNAEEVSALRAYLDSLRLPPNPYQAETTPAASAARQRGEKLFLSAAVGCAQCHAGPHFTDGEIHDVGLAGSSDKYQGYNTPSLRGAYSRVRFLHDGRARSLYEVLTKWHDPAEIGGGAELNDQQLDDLIAYLKSL
ncbi:MAG: c-type cytochrome [Planctomycetales bacterium]|nr:c-type cytochrome [Planctomycetales bacterium]